MKLVIQNLSLVNFRSYPSARFDLAERTVLVGRNAAGKTNLLEALYLLASAKSFRADRELEMLHWGELAGRVEANMQRDNATHKVAAQLVAGGRGVQKTFTVDGNKRKSRELVRQFPMTLFSADDIRLIDGSPGRRRRALDLALGQSSVAYYDALSRYNRALASRNRLLEGIAAGEAGSGELDPWDAQLIEAGQAVINGRQEFADYLNDRLTELYRGVAGDETAEARLQLAYRPLAGDLSSAVIGRRDQDIAVGTTTAGPHRDDWSLLLGNRPLVSFGSGGEYRSATLAFRLGEAAWQTQALGVRPALLLDDVFSELDERRRQSLLSSLPAGQTIITTPEAKVLPKTFAETAAVITIESKTKTDV